MEVACYCCKGRGFIRDWKDISLCLVSPFLIVELFGWGNIKNGFGRQGCNICQGEGFVNV